MPDTAPDLAIDDVLADLGYAADTARPIARAALEVAGLTSARKQRIAATKLDAVKDLLAARFLLACARATCRAAGAGRTVLDAAQPTDCGVCGGSENRAAVDRAVAALTARGRRRIVVVGGSPATHEELRALVGGRLDLRLVSGTERRTGRDAKADLAWADVVVIWGSTELDHKVSKLYTDARERRVVTCPRRGVAALAETLVVAAGR